MAHAVSEAGLLWGLFSAAFLSATLLPGGSEAALYLALKQQSADPMHLWLAASLGNTLGGLSSWGIGRWLLWRYPGRGLSKPDQREALERLRRHGSPILLLSWVPVIGDPLCLAAGWIGIDWCRALLFIAVGKAIRYALILLLI